MLTDAPEINVSIFSLKELFLYDNSYIFAHCLVNSACESGVHLSEGWLPPFSFAYRVL